MLDDLASGECRWIDDHGIHVYCHHPMRSWLRPDCREAWRRCEEDRRYRVVCDEAGIETGWVGHDEAALTIRRILAGSVPAAA